jgi:hypothetical protein
MMGQAAAREKKGGKFEVEWMHRGLKLSSLFIYLFSLLSVCQGRR